MDLKIKNKIALVTAASKGLGKAVALQLAKENAQVIICSRDRANLEKASAEISSITGNEIKSYQCDVSNENDVIEMMEKLKNTFGRIDILVTNAGGPPSGGFGDFEMKDYRNAIELNLLSSINLCKLSVPLMKKNSWGRIILITSISVKQPIDNLILSNTARAGVIGFMKTLSNSVASFNITVNSVCPGYTKTGRVINLAKAQAKKNGSTVEDFYANLEHKIPMKRIGTTEEFAQTVAFLTSEGAGYITGVSLKIDGGFGKGLF